MKSFFLLQLTFSQVFSLWFVNVENDGSITPDKAIVFGVKTAQCGRYIKKNMQPQEQQSLGSVRLSLLLSAAAAVALHSHQQVFKLVGGPRKLITL